VHVQGDQSDRLATGAREPAGFPVDRHREVLFSGGHRPGGRDGELPFAHVDDHDGVRERHVHEDSLPVGRELEGLRVSPQEELGFEGAVTAEAFACRVPEP